MAARSRASRALAGPLSEPWAEFREQGQVLCGEGMAPAAGHCLLALEDCAWIGQAAASRRLDGWIAGCLAGLQAGCAFAAAAAAARSLAGGGKARGAQ